MKPLIHRCAACALQQMIRDVVRVGLSEGQIVQDLQVSFWFIRLSKF